MAELKKLKRKCVAEEQHAKAVDAVDLKSKIDIYLITCNRSRALVFQAQIVQGADAKHETKRLAEVEQNTEFAVNAKAEELLAQWLQVIVMRCSVSA